MCDCLTLRKKEHLICVVLLADPLLFFYPGHLFIHLESCIFTFYSEIYQKRIHLKKKKKRMLQQVFKSCVHLILELRMNFYRTVYTVVFTSTVIEKLI